MAVTIYVFQLPVVANTAAPILHAINLVGNYGTTDVDVIIPNAQPSVQNVLPLNPVVRYSDAPIPWNKNPIDRNDLQHPVAIPAGATFTNRHLLLKMLYIFLFPAHNNNHSDVTFQVSRVNNIIYYLNGPLGQQPGPMTDANGVPMPAGPGRYGIPFEELIAHNANPNLEKYFVFQEYSLLGVSQLLVRAEVDCMNQVPEITEIKSRNTPNYPVWNDAGYFKTVWAQMLFGCTKSLVIGLHVPIPPAQDGTPQVRFTTITARTFEEVAVLARMDTEATYMPSMTSLANLVEWIRANIADGENKTFSYSMQAQTFTMV